MKRAVATCIAAAISWWAIPSAAADTSADLFISQAYAPWINPALKRISDTDLMSPEFMALWHADDAAAEKANVTGVIDGNLICDCRDGQMGALDINTHRIGATHATARVSFTIDGMARDQLMLLKQTQGRWYIDDIVRHNKSLRAQLREDARMRGKIRQKSTN